MSYGIASPEQVAMMARVLDTYCKQRGIVVGPERDTVGEKVLALFDNGHRTEVALRAALADEHMRGPPPTNGTSRLPHGG